MGQVFSSPSPLCLWVKYPSGHIQVYIYIYIYIYTHTHSLKVYFEYIELKLIKHYKSKF